MDTLLNGIKSLFWQPFAMRQSDEWKYWPFGKTTLSLRKHESTFCIQGLPMELLIEVLLMARNDTLGNTKNLQRLASVCKYWREVILKTPQFWRIMDTRDGRDAWSRVLRRNFKGPLDVRIFGFDHVANWADANRLREFANLLKPESKRIRSIEYQAGLSLGYIQSFLDGNPFPLLSDVKVLVSPAPQTPYFLNVGDGVPFQHLHLSGAVIPWDSPRLSGLETITLWGIHQNAPTVSALHHILSLAPRLRRLSLFSWTNFDDPSSVNEELPTITLPLLSSLVIRSVCDPTNSRLLSMLEAPMLKEIRWLSVGGLDSGSTLLRLSKGCIQAAPELAIHWTQWGGRLVIRSESWFDSRSSKPPLSEIDKTVDIEIDGIADPSPLMGTVGKLLCPSHKVRFTASSERVMTSVTDILRGSGAKFSVRLPEFIRY